MVQIIAYAIITGAFYGLAAVGLSLAVKRYREWKLSNGYRRILESQSRG
jgi:branched-subunit amino acid ABC-type transport system permease component